MPKLKANTERLNVFLSKKDAEFIRSKAAADGSSVSDIIRRAVKDYIAESKRKSADG